jgi:hypothetical protein
VYAFYTPPLPPRSPHPPDEIKSLWSVSDTVTSLSERLRVLQGAMVDVWGERGGGGGGGR